MVAVFVFRLFRIILTKIEWFCLFEMYYEGTKLHNHITKSSEHKTQESLALAEVEIGIKL